MAQAVRAEQWLQALQTSGYRITRPLRAIIDVLITSECALSPVEVYDQGRQEYPQLGLVTVYRALEKLEELHLVERVHLPDGCHRYLRSATGHEHLLLCVRCGRAVFFAGDNLDELIQGLAARTGFEIREHWLQLFGLCTTCQAG